MLSPFVTSNVVLSCLVRMADILARLVQKADSLSALQLIGALFTINWGTLCQTHLPPPPIHPYPRHFLDRSAAPVMFMSDQYESGDGDSEDVED